MEGVKWKSLTPDKRNNWITNDMDDEFDSFIPIGSKAAKAKGGIDLAIFKTYSLGVSTNRDAVVYDFDRERLAKRVEQFIEDYNAEMRRWQKKQNTARLDDFLQTDRVKWSETLKKHLTDGVEGHFSGSKIRDAMYRPFCKMWLYYDQLLNDRPGAFAEYFPAEAEPENRLLTVNLSPERPFCTYCCNITPSKDVGGGFGSPTYCFPSHTFTGDGKKRQENVTAKAQSHFQTFYVDRSITCVEIFHYVYALLHHPSYRKRYAENLRRELPRIPLVGVAAVKKNATLAAFFSAYDSGTVPSGEGAGHDLKVSAGLFHEFAKAGKKLADLHVNYESAEEFPLKREESKEAKLDWRVDVMRLSRDGQKLHYNDFLTLDGIPPEVFEYRLGNRSALEWVIDQYRVTHDENGVITSDPNRLGDEQYIERLIRKVVIISLETIKIIGALPRIEAGKV